MARCCDAIRPDAVFARGVGFRTRQKTSRPMWGGLVEQQKRLQRPLVSGC